MDQLGPWVIGAGAILCTIIGGMLKSMFVTPKEADASIRAELDKIKADLERVKAEQARLQIDLIKELSQELRNLPTSKDIERLENSINDLRNAIMQLPKASARSAG